MEDLVTRKRSEIEEEEDYPKTLSQTAWREAVLSIHLPSRASRQGLIASPADQIVVWVYEQNLCVKSTIERYKKASADSSNTGSVSEANAQYYQQEAAKLRSQIGNLQNSNRHMLGEALSSLSVKELKSLEIRLEKGISRIRSKKISENERKRQNMNLMPGGVEFEIMQSQPYDSRNYSQVNGLPPANHYPHQDQMALQLV
ncbi:hypothetical protein DKX38_005699 [Salix brachista]|uniref:K-box domain-containing protein n=1 Tax=Salix brachista TaxID=2182728 RepID=A0A5N5N0P4_9ROSI|nr:hypothetical protein DKX38_005699 [Salix brachista]